LDAGSDSGGHSQHSLVAMKKPVTRKPMVVVAAPTRDRSLPWVHGPVHIDKQTKGVCSFLHMLHDVTSQNGAMKFWPNTTESPFNPKNGVDQQEPSKETTNKDGTLLVFDSRMVHQSLPNTTEGQRLVISGFVCSQKMDAELPPHDCVAAQHHGVVMMG